MGSYSLNGNGKNSTAKPMHTITSLGRWSISSSQLPPVEKITTVHIYDFDNTLFKTPLPNPKLWNGITIGQLSSPDIFVSGGWWHNSRFLSLVGDGSDKEEARAWNGWWNENVVQLVRLSMEQSDALTVLLTGRSEHGFSDIVKRMVKSKGLHFDMIGLKPVVGPNNECFNSTMEFKQHFITEILHTYKHAVDITIYEDRPKHVKQFDEFLQAYKMRSQGSARTPLQHIDVIHVQEIARSLDPVVEVAEVQQLINHHNDQIAKVSDSSAGNRLVLRKTVFFTGYMISPADSQKLLTLTQLPSSAESDLKVLANSIMICPRSCSQSVLEKVGGIGSKMTWEVFGTGCYEGNLWAVNLRPVPPHATYHTENPTPLVILALRKGARPFDASRIQNWQPLPPEKRFYLETTVNEKVVLRIETQNSGDGDEAFVTVRTRHKRKHQADEEYPRHHAPPFANKASGDRGAGAGRGGRGGFRGGNGQGGNATGGQLARSGYKNTAKGHGGGRNGGGRGRGGGYHGYKSLDDVEPKGAHAMTGGYGFPAAVYDDEPPQPQRSFGGMGQHQWQGQPLPGLQTQGQSHSTTNGNADALSAYY